MTIPHRLFSFTIRLSVGDGMVTGIAAPQCDWGGMPFITYGEVMGRIVHLTFLCVLYVP